MTMNRRGFLATGLAAPALGALSPLAHAAESAERDGYRALVCVYLLGGMDGHDTLIPVDAERHRDWTKARGSLAGRYAEAGRARDLSAALPVGRDASGAGYGLPPEMPRMAGLIGEGRASVVANVGPLRGPVTPSQLRAQSVPLPPKLFSHKDQQRYWRSLAGATGPLTGWGGRMADALPPQGAFGVVAASRDDGFGHSLGGPPVTVNGLKPHTPFGTKDKLYGHEDLADLFRRHLGTPPEDGGYLERAFAWQQADALAVSRELAALLRRTEDGESVAEGKRRGDFAYALGVIAKMIALREHSGARRQVFYVELGGFDTHRDQSAELPPLQAELDAGIGRFADWLAREGLSDSVTLFTASDFGRTLVPNGLGTDHGWGGHSFVVGGAARGGAVHDEVPPPVTGHALDAGRGRLIPSLSVEQMAVPLARWLGVPEADMGTVFPYADRFDLDALDLVAG